MDFQPTIIIGLGGTGVKILSRVKLNILQLNHGIIPNKIRLLCFDTEPVCGELDEYQEFYLLKNDTQNSSKHKRKKIKS